MIFAMDEIGFENVEKINTVASEADRWRFIYDTALSYGFDGIHITPSLYESFNLDVRHIPDYFQDLHLTFHFGGIYKILTKNDYLSFDNELEKGFELALKHTMHDISVHPPFIYECTLAEKSICLDFFHEAIEKWLKVSLKSGISFSLETHVSGEFFLFDGLSEYVKFINLHPELGVLIDVSHNYYDKYSEEDIINFLSNKNIKGLHISDAVPGVDFKKGTHLAIGYGTINFSELLKGFENFSDLYGALEIKTNNEGIRQSLNILKEI